MKRPVLAIGASLLLASPFFTFQGIASADGDTVAITAAPPQDSRALTPNGRLAPPRNFGPLTPNGRPVTKTRPTTLTPHVEEPNWPFGPSHRSGGVGDIDCVCQMQFSSGDRVVALVDNPQGSNIPAGSVGTVYCGWDYSEPGWLYVSWDNWNDGNNQDNCECGTSDGVDDDSHWWVHCDEVANITPSCLGDTNGDGIVNIDDLLNVLSTWGVCP